MNRTVRNFGWLLLLGVAVAHAQDEFERVVPADARGAVEVVNLSGEVHVRGWERNEVRISGDVSGGSRLEISAAGGRTSVSVVTKARGNNGGRAELLIEAPRESTLSVNTISADQSIEGMRGAQRLQAVSGSITTEQWAQDLEAKSISGDMVVRAHGGAAQTALNTVSGRITLIDAPAQFSVETITGDMKVSVDEAGRGRIRTTNGNLHFTGRLAREGRLDAEAINGDLQFTLREPLNVQFDVETFNGDIVNCFGPKPVRTREFAPGNALRFVQGNGDARVRIKTLNGGVRICKN